MRPLLLLLALLTIAFSLHSQVPLTNSFSPASGPAGTSVTITGSHFSSAAADNNVYFGTLKAVVTAASATSLTVTVPPGATSHPLTVTVNGLAGYSTSSFMATYNAIGLAFNSSTFNAPLNLAGDGEVSDADMDGDGYSDLLYSRFSFNEVRILRNKGNGFSFSFSDFVWGGGTNPLTVKGADLNGDGLPELLVLSTWDESVNIFKNNSTPGNISLGWPGIALAATDGVRNFAVGDLDGDGKPDVVVTNAGSNTISLFRNTSTGGNISFSAKTDLATTTAPESVTLGDIDGDGKPEIAVAGYSASAAVSLFTNNSAPGTLTFAPKQDLVVAGWAWDTRIADIDGDGKADLLATCQSPATVAVFRNTSSGAVTFAPRIDLPTEASPRGMAVADLNGDGKPEILTANWFVNSNVAVLSNVCTPGTISFEPFVPYTANTGTGRITVADLNRDGAPDIITSNSQSHSLSYFQNNNSVKTGPACPALIAPAYNSSIPHFQPTRFVWRKDNLATGYQLKITQAGSTVLDITTADTSYAFMPAPGLYYSWSVRPANSPGPEWTCTESKFWSCPVIANSTTIIADGATTICSNDSIKLWIATTSAYQWYRDGQEITGATNNFIWVKTPGSYTVRGVGSCHTEPSQPVVITVQPAPAKPTLAQHGPTGFCAGGSVQFTSSLDINNQWFKDETPINGANGISYTASVSGLYYVRVANTTSGCYNYSDTVRVTATPLPATPVITAVGPSTVCTGTQVQLQSSSGSGNVWYKDNAPLGFGAQSAFLDQSGSYTVQVSLNGCNSAVSAPFAVTVNPIPATPTLNVTGNQRICLGDSLKLESSATSGNEWYKDLQPIAGAIAKTYQAKQAGTYAVRVTDNGCTSAFSSNALLQTDPLPTKPVITVNSSVLSTATTYTGYKWYLNNNLIQGATTHQHTATQSGVYRVVVNQTTSCSISSDELNFVYTAVNDIEWQGYTITWFPNPVQDQLNLRVSQQAGMTGNMSVSIVDAQGRLAAAEQRLKPGSNQVQMASLRSGTYWVIIRNGQSAKAFKIMKAK